MKDKLLLLSTIEYKAYGHPMTGIFHSLSSIIPEQNNKFFYYFRNAEDKRLKEIQDQYFVDPEECLDYVIQKLTEFGYFKINKYA